jgi:hypothetical protein
VICQDSLRVFLHLERPQTANALIHWLRSQEQLARLQELAQSVTGTLRSALSQLVPRKRDSP